jgi:serine/threonine-protein kinase RsbW
MQLQFVLRLPTDSKSVPIVRSLCRQALSLLGADRQIVTDVALAVTEACANVVLHSSSLTSFEVRVEIDDWDCTITVSDQGSGFDPERVRAAMSLGETGRGIELMRLLVDDLHFVPAEGGTVVRLTKHLRLSDALAHRAIDEAARG